MLVCVAHLQVIFADVLYVVFFHMFKCFPFLSFNIWLEYRELLLLFQIACMCTFYLVRQSLSVCPVYLS
jgi:hypothetical protein